MIPRPGERFKLVIYKWIGGRLGRQSVVVRSFREALLTAEEINEPHLFKIFNEKNQLLQSGFGGDTTGYDLSLYAYL